MNQKGFSLVELLISVTVLLIIGGIGTSSYIRQLERGRDQQRHGDLARIQSALEKYRADHGTYPNPDILWCETSAGTCSTDCPCSTTGSNWPATGALQKLVAEDYLETLPVDPINDATYHYGYEVLCFPEVDDLICGRRIKCTTGCCAYTLGAVYESDGQWEPVCSASAIQ